MSFIKAGTGIATMLLLACGSGMQNVTTDFDGGYDFSRLKTFTSSVGSGWGNELSERRVLASIDSVLTSKGWAKSPNPAEADAAVILHGTTEEKQDLQTYYDTPAYAGWGWYSVGPTYSTTRSYEYTMGTLVVDIFDQEAKSLVFRGVATDELSSSKETNQQRLQSAWHRMFENFPPKR